MAIVGDLDSVLLRDALTVEDRVAALDGPRPGVWADETEADLRGLTQDETDVLVRRELAAGGAPPELDEIVHASGGPRAVIVPISYAPRFWVRHQRGGIDSHPLVRILARRSQRWSRESRWRGVATS